MPHSGAIARGIPQSFKVPFRKPDGRRVAILSITIHQTDFAGPMRDIESTVTESIQVPREPSLRLHVVFAEGFIPLKRDAGIAEVVFECILQPPSARSSDLLDEKSSVTNCVPDLYASSWGVSADLPCRYCGKSLFNQPSLAQLLTESWGLQLACRNAASFGHSEITQRGHLSIPWSKLLSQSLVETWVEFPSIGNMDTAPGKVRVVLSLDDSEAVNDDCTDDSFIGGGRVFVWEKGTFNTTGRKALPVFHGDLTCLYEETDDDSFSESQRVFASEAMSVLGTGQLVGSVPIVGARCSALIRISVSKRGDRIEANLPLEQVLAPTIGSSMSTMALQLVSRKKGMVQAAGIVNISAIFVPYVEGVVTVRVDKCQLLSVTGLEGMQTSIRLVVPGCFSGFSPIVSLDRSSGPLAEFQFPLNTFRVLSEIRGTWGLTAILEVHSISEGTSVAVYRCSVALHPLFNLALQGSLSLSANDLSSATAKMQQDVALTSIDGLSTVQGSFRLYIDFTLLSIEQKVLKYLAARKLVASSCSPRDAVQELRLKELFVKTDSDNSGQISFDEVCK